MIILRRKNFSKNKTKAIYETIKAKEKIVNGVKKKMGKETSIVSDYQRKRKAIEIKNSVDSAIFEVGTNPGGAVRKIGGKIIENPATTATVIAPLPGSALLAPTVNKVEQRTTGKFTKKLAKGIDKVAGQAIEDGVNAFKYLPI